MQRVPAIAVLGLVAIAIAAVGLVLLVWLPPHLVGDVATVGTDQVTAENDARGVLIQAVGGLVLVAGLVFTARSYVAAREGRVTDRYTAAVDQLGAERLPVRLGGIYALERIARDSSRDRDTVTSIMSALVRDTPRPLWSDRPGPEVVAALEVLSRLPGAGGVRAIDLRGVDLSGLRMTALALAGADLTRSRLTGAHLPGADLRGATLDHAEATRVHLVDGRLADVRATNATFQSAYLDRAVLVRARFEGAVLAAASLRGVDAREATFTGTDLSTAQFEADPGGPPTRVAKAEFTDADLDRTSLGGVDLGQASGLTTAQRAAASVDAATLWPKRLA